MHPETTDDDVGRLVRAAAPAVEAPAEPAVDRVWNRVAAVVYDVAPRRRRRGRLVAGTGVAALVLGAGGVAAADMWSAHTGRPVTDPEVEELSGPGEHIDPMAPDYVEVYDELTADIDFPDARSRAVSREIELEIHDRDVADARRSGDIIGEVSGGIRAQAARDAICSWGNEWAEATASGDTAGREQAIAALQLSVSWSAVTDIDAEQTYGPSETWTDPDSGRTRVFHPHETEFAYLPRVVAAADGRDLAVMGTLLEDCWEELVPALPRQSAPAVEGQR
ncbi:hypothetical protein [Nocardioides sp. TF02-7]|uniref:hypothetical protein n=1 Tax=Nocardioides sp. TF02-7 TaxID=2917724 RepID=UPI001F052724|nr:hypothetical protein [Nocardioides sp. TF02-7]UMG94216.1 hypothetical protein MF408_09460 [Nocardioides sp. TF02-7]